MENVPRLRRLSGHRRVRALLPAPDDNLGQLAHEWQHARFAVLGVLPAQRYPRGALVDGRPLERRDLAFAPPRAIREPSVVLQVHRQPRDEPLPGVVFSEELHARDRGCRQAFLLAGDRKGAPEGGELSVDGGLRLSCGATLVRVALDTGGLHVVRFVLPEGFAERGQAEGQCRARAPPVRRVVGHQGIEELRHRHAAFRHRIPTTIARGFVDSTAQELDRIGVALALARLAPTLAVLASLDPPDPTAAVDRAEALEMLAMRRRGWRDLREELRDHRGRRHRGLFVLATSVHVGPPCAPSDTLPRPARAARRHPFGPRPQQSSAAPAAPPEERSWSASAPARPCLETWASAVLAIEDLRVAPHVLR